jgi:hypothetical protein
MPTSTAYPASMQWLEQTLGTHINTGTVAVSPTSASQTARPINLDECIVTPAQLNQTHPHYLTGLQEFIVDNKDIELKKLRSTRDLLSARVKLLEELLSESVLFLDPNSIAAEDFETRVKKTVLRGRGWR